MRRYKTRQKSKSYYTYGLMDIANIILSVPWRDLSCENVSKRIWYPFERLGVSVPKKLSSVQTAWATRLKKIVIRSKGLGYPFEKIVICSNSSGYPFEKEFVDHSSNWSYLFKDKFSPSFHPKTISSLANCVKRSVFLQVMYVTKFVYKRIIYRSLLHCTPSSPSYYQSIIDSINVRFIRYLSFFFATSFPKILFFTFYASAVYEPAERNFIFLACQEHKTRKIIFFNWLHFFFSWLFLYHKEVTRVFSSTLNFAWQFSYQWNWRCAILPKTQMCNEVLISLIILLQVLLSSWCSARKVQLCFLRDLAFHLQNCRIQQKLHEMHKICLWLERIRSLHLKKFDYLLSIALSTNDVTNFWSLLWLRY